MDWTGREGNGTERFFIAKYFVKPYHVVKTEIPYAHLLIVEFCGRFL